MKETESRKVHYKELEVIEARALTGTIRSVRLERPGDFEFRAGQPVMLGIPAGGRMERRTLSIASGPARPWLEFATRLTGSAFKNAFSGLQPGDRVELRGITGDFFLDVDRPAVLVAAGIGITVLKSMVEDTVDKRPDMPLTLVCGNHDPAAIPFREELGKIAADSPRIRLIHTVSEPDGSWEGHTGRIGIALLEEAATGYDHPVFYAAGPPTMVEDIRRMLEESGVPANRIRSEMFGGYE